MISSHKKNKLKKKKLYRKNIILLFFSRIHTLGIYSLLRKISNKKMGEQKKNTFLGPACRLVILIALFSWIFFSTKNFWFIVPFRIFSYWRASFWFSFGHKFICSIFRIWEHHNSHKVELPKLQGNSFISLLIRKNLFLSSTEIWHSFSSPYFLICFA